MTQATEEGAVSRDGMLVGPLRPSCYLAFGSR